MALMNRPLFAFAPHFNAAQHPRLHAVFFNPLSMTRPIAKSLVSASIVLSAVTSSFAQSTPDYSKEGNVTPHIVQLTPEQEKQVLSDVKVPEGFDLTLFANPQAANYPGYVSAATHGDVYV